MSDVDRIDPTGLFREVYQMDDATPEVCRTIFFNWAVGHRDMTEATEDIDLLLATYGSAAPDHPMTKVLEEAKSGTTPPRGRRGGAMGRRN